MSWTSDRLENHRAEFVSQGQIDLPVSEFQSSVPEFLVAVTGRLEELRLTGTLLQEEWGAIRGADPEENEFCSAVASLGLDPYAVDDSLAASALEAGIKLPRSVQKEFFAAADSDALGALRFS